MFLRTYRISDPEFLDEEIRKIQSIGQTIKYPLYILNQCHNTAKKRFYKVETIETQRPATQITLVLPYHENFLDITKP